MPLRVTEEDIDTEYDRKMARARRHKKRMDEKREAQKPRKVQTGVGDSVTSITIGGQVYYNGK